MLLAGCQDPASTNQGSSRSEIRIVGSSTVFPFAKKVSEEFVNFDPERRSPILESTGTGGGIELFCSGVGANTPDIVNASRRMKKNEFDRCITNGVEEIVEVIIGFDGIALAQSKNGPKINLSVAEFYTALAAEPFGKGPNTTRRWPDINPALPDTRINIFGPPSTSGTRDALEEIIMEKGCKTDPAVGALADSDKDKFEEICHTVRTDQGYTDAGENDNLIVQKLSTNPDAVGIFSYSYLADNAETVRGIPINGVEPSYATIESGQYPGARTLFIYIKKKHVDVIPGLREFLAEYLRGGEPDGYLTRIGLISSPAKMRSEMLERIKSLPTLDGAVLE
ncbi:substrate-binding domain-containing protein [Blastomonas aquatica]|uniref:substrate-binding domain-containing protein n=1 Tax=Blastomonas aquatica TaxID=1510276 RepID=UPI00166C8756|nr:substrate-binding domain-containing protein [Blastomonas aquatica]